MVDDVRLAVNGDRPVHFYGRTGGMVPTVADVVSEIQKYATPSESTSSKTSLEQAIDEKLQTVTDAVDQILKRTKTKLHNADSNQ